ncbi:TetR/AcrR family transcriptional regulator [Ammoniphilus sp. YIM 78166]|uniref:TetR/AcrR family transcriptional regulator n=1 Tax=Ammoniphilus sp. YIM 78166 TaxID=1644106 RepID=UPI00106FC644|nr:TetR/AcrR family transcriptional regulator [Ammoniphilus sp. YIM 78166]
MKEEDYFDDIMQKFLDELKDEDKLTDKQRRIMEASIKLFSEKGFHAASTSEIAKEAGVAEGTIFRHFKTKKDILISLVAPLVTRFAAPLILRDVKKIMESGLPMDQLLKWLYQNRLSLLEKNWERIRLILQEIQFQPELREIIVDNLIRVVRDWAEVFIAQKIREGELRQLPPLAITRSMVSMIIGYVFFKYILFPEEGMQLDDEKEIETMVDILLNGILA